MFGVTSTWKAGPPAGAGWGVNSDEVLGVMNGLCLQEGHSYGVRPQDLSYSNLQFYRLCC